MWASRASLETWGGLTLAVAIDCVMPPFGDITLIPMLTLLILSTLPSFKKQFVVVLVSITSTKLVFEVQYLEFFCLKFVRFNYTRYWRSSASVCSSRSARVLDGSTYVFWSAYVVVECCSVLVVRVLIFTRITVVFHVCGNTMRSAVGFFLFTFLFLPVAPLPYTIAPCFVSVGGRSLVDHIRH